MNDLRNRLINKEISERKPQTTIDFEELEKELMGETSSSNSPYQKRDGYDGVNKNYNKSQNYNRNTTQKSPSQKEYNQYRKPETNQEDLRTGMSTVAWSLVFTITEWVMDFIKGFMIIGGIIAANLADFIMGSIGISLIVNTKISSLTFVNGFGFGSILSMGASAIQIYMWSLIQKRGITAKMLLTPKLWKNIPSDIKGFLGTALFLWLIDTLLDVSPTFVLFTRENFTTMPTLYYVLVVSVVIIVTILCGFAEILTSNMRAMLSGSK